MRIISKFLELENVLPLHPLANEWESHNYWVM